MSSQGDAASRAAQSIDTLLFDAMLIWVVWQLATRFRRGFRDPVVWVDMLAAVPLALSLMYAISNLGTHVRHRGMVLMLIAVLPALASRSAQDDAEAASVEARATSPAAVAPPAQAGERLEN